MGCRRSERETPAPLWWGALVGQDKASHEAALETDSSEGLLEPGRCLSSTELDGERDRRGVIKCLNNITEVKISAARYPSQV